MERQEILEAQLEVSEELSSLGDGVHDTSEVVVEEHDRGHLPRCPCSSLAHRYADVGDAKCWNIVDAVARYHDDLSLALERSDEAEFLRRHCSSDDVHFGKPSCELVNRQSFELVSADHFGGGGTEPDRARHRTCSFRMVTRDHDDPDAGLAASRYRFFHAIAWGVFEDERSEKIEPAVGLSARPALVERTRRTRDDLPAPRCQLPNPTQPRLTRLVAQSTRVEDDLRRAL